MEQQVWCLLVTAHCSRCIKMYESIVRWLHKDGVMHAIQNMVTAYADASAHPLQQELCKHKA